MIIRTHLPGFRSVGVLICDVCYNKPFINSLAKEDMPEEFLPGDLMPEGWYLYQPSNHPFITYYGGPAIHICQECKDLFIDKGLPYPPND